MSGLILKAAQALAAVVFAWSGYGFGIQIGGAPMGLLAAANCALFAWLMVPALAEMAQRLVVRRPRRGPG